MGDAAPSGMPPAQFPPAPFLERMGYALTPYWAHGGPGYALHRLGAKPFSLLAKAQIAELPAVPEHAKNQNKRLKFNQATYAEASRKNTLHATWAYWRHAQCAFEGLVPEPADIAAVIISYEDTLKKMANDHEKALARKDTEIRQACPPPRPRPRL